MRQFTPDRILQTGLAFWPSKTLLSAIEMGVFTELANGTGGSILCADDWASILARRGISWTPW